MGLGIIERAYDDDENAKGGWECWWTFWSVTAHLWWRSAQRFAFAVTRSSTMGYPAEILYSYIMDASREDHTCSLTLKSDQPPA